MTSLWLIKALVFLSAFLLFQIELIIGKIFLPLYGGSFMVWGACMVFFQALLLLGYIYAHFIVQKMRLERYRYGHLVLVLLPLCFFPGRPLSVQYTTHQLPMVLDVFLQLMWALGPVFFVLSTMSIIYQAWLAGSDLPERSNPYALFAVSNLGSFTALLTYPFIFEMYMDLELQQNIWRIGYLVVIVLQVLATRSIRFSHPNGPSEEPAQGATQVQKTQIGRWLLFGCAGVMMFLSVTNIITLAITPTPLLWVLPLAIYLLTYVLNFKKKSYCPWWIKDHFDLAMVYGVFLYFLLQTDFLPALLGLLLILGFLFIVCMYCQHKLYEERPKDEEKLTLFYLMTALGGFCGGIIVTWIVPLCSTSMSEYFLGLLAIYLARLLNERERRVGRIYLRYIFYWIAILILWPTVFHKISLPAILVMLVILKFIISALKNNVMAVTTGLSIVIMLLAVVEPSWTKEPGIFKNRNYYGISKVVEDNGFRMLVHGKTIHGTQYFDPNNNIMSLLYYHSDTPIGRLFNRRDFTYEKIGAVGLGVGALSVFIGPGQEIDFFELDPDVQRIAERYFEFTKRSRGKIQHITGDGRISLSRENDKEYDIIVVDVFSGDSIPTHFLTKEAFQLYREKIKDDGVILFHLSNQFFDPVKVMFATAFAVDANACYLDGRRKYRDVFNSKWFALTWDAKTFDLLISRLDWETIDRRSLKDVRIWTDKFTNVLLYIDFFKGVPFIKRKG